MSFRAVCTIVLIDMTQQGGAMIKYRIKRGIDGLTIRFVKFEFTDRCRCSDMFVAGLQTDFLLLQMRLLDVRSW